MDLARVRDDRSVSATGFQVHILSGLFLSTHNDDFRQIATAERACDVIATSTCEHIVVGEQP
jgi:hypothetical protein